MVAITWSLTNGGTGLTDTQDHGNTSNGLTTTAIEFFVRHDGSNSITGCKLYIREYSGTYTGDATAAADIAEILSWGDASTSSTFGGFQINMDAVGGYPSASWPTYISKTPTNGYVCKTGTADSEGNAVTITTATGATASGTIQAGASPNVRFKCRIQVPTAEDTIGLRLFESVLVYTYTS